VCFYHGSKRLLATFFCVSMYLIPSDQPRHKTHCPAWCCQVSGSSGICRLVQIPEAVYGVVMRLNVTWSQELAKWAEGNEHENKSKKSNQDVVNSGLFTLFFAVLKLVAVRLYRFAVGCGSLFSGARRLFKVYSLPHTIVLL
jgi:hypothetical protein